MPAPVSICHGRCDNEFAIVPASARHSQSLLPSEDLSGAPSTPLSFQQGSRNRQPPIVPASLISSQSHLLSDETSVAPARLRIDSSRKVQPRVRHRACLNLSTAVRPFQAKYCQSQLPSKTKDISRAFRLHYSCGTEDAIACAPSCLPQLMNT